VPLLAVLSQLSPLHWHDEPIAPGTTHKLSSGKVWYVAPARLCGRCWRENKKEPRFSWKTAL